MCYCIILMSIQNFNPRPPRGGRQLLQGFQHPHLPISIHALREEGDSISKTSKSLMRNFNPRPPRGERPALSRPLRRRSSDFNPRPPRGERPAASHRSAAHLYFNPRPPRGERLAGKRHNNQQNFISIHALREESDQLSAGTAAHVDEFQSTPSARRATGGAGVFHALLHISIHALREESDPVGGPMQFPT